jgi:signal transduction histidine kinase
MPTAIWGEPAPQGDEAYPLASLRHLVHQMMVQFIAQGACLALYDPILGQMVVRLHVRLRDAGGASAATSAGAAREGVHRIGRRTTINLQDPSSSAVGRLKRMPGPQEELEDVPPRPGGLFPVGSSYAQGQDLIGYVWRENRSCIMEHESYLYAFHAQRKLPLALDVRPYWYFAAPIQEPALAADERASRVAPQVLGVVVLYKLMAAPGFDLKQRQEVHAFTERMALYLENHRLRLIQRRTSEQLQSLQQLSAIFPSTVNLAYLLEQVYHFTSRIVDVSAMLVTLYDRDTQMIYDVYAVRDGKPVEGLPTESAEPRTRQQWWRVAQEEKRTLLLSPAHLKEHEYDELLRGVWGDQRLAESFLLLPMKMFNRVIGTVSLASQRPNAYRYEDVQVLETMVQIITVGIENARLYERSRRLLRKARQREESLAAMNSALQSISSVLNLTEMLDNFVRAVANLVGAEMSVFFQLSPDRQELIAQALYAPASKNASNETPPAIRPEREKHNELELIGMIHLPFKGSLLERLAEEEAFFYLDAELAEELAQTASEGGAIFLRETYIKRMIMIPVRYQTELVGLLALHTPRQERLFKPEEVGVLLAICGQAASAIRNAQLFEQIQEANAELQRMNTLKDEFIVTASHELRTPLSAISGYASLLKRQGARATPQQILRFASKIAASAQQLASLVANMTEAANVDALGRKLELHPSPVELRTAVQMAVSMLSINIEQEISVTVPEGIWLHCDPQLLRQVLTNLLDNAAKYSPPESHIEITVREMTLGSVPLPEELIDHQAIIEQGADLPVAVVSVCDEGEGIEPEEQHKIFEKFVRASRTLTTPVRGSGLGLYICRRFIEAMGGKLWLERSVPGEGSIFSFYLPRISPPPEAREQDEEPLSDDGEKM